jgi:hypothetical protein
MLSTCTLDVDAQNLEGSAVTTCGVCWLGSPEAGSLGACGWLVEPQNKKCNDYPRILR